MAPQGGGSHLAGAGFPWLGIPWNCRSQRLLHKLGNQPTSRAVTLRRINEDVDGASLGQIIVVTRRCRARRMTFQGNCIDASHTTIETECPASRLP